MRIAIVGAGAIGSTFALRLARAGHDVTLVVRNEGRRERLAREGLRGRNRLGRGTERAEVRLTPALDDDYDLVIVPVQRHQIDSLVPTLSANGSRQVMFMFNCAAGDDRWVDEIGADRLVWGFPAALADVRDDVVEYLVVPRVARLAQITTLGRPDGAVTPELRAVRDAFDDAGIPTTIETDIDGWLKTHVAYMGPIMAMGYLPERTRLGPRFGWAEARRLAGAIQAGFAAVRGSGARITPLNMRLLDRLPAALLAVGLWAVFWSPMAKRSLAAHAGSAPREVAVLLEELQALAREAGIDASPFARLAEQVPSAT